MSEAIERLELETVHPIPVDAPAAAERSVPLLRIERSGSELAQLELAGPLWDDWPLQLARSCAARNISWLNGYAVSTEAGMWEAHLELDVRGCAGPLPDLFDLLSRGARVGAALEPPLLEVELSRVESGPGEIEIEVHAWDSVGLLAGVLGRIDGAGYVPRALSLETEDECAFHRVALVRRDGRRSSQRQRRELARSLFALAT